MSEPTVSEPLIFLDFDGVLNSSKFLSAKREQAPISRKERRLVDHLMMYSLSGQDELAARRTILVDLRHLDPEPIVLLNEIVRESQAKVVVSSTWRLGYDAQGLQILLESQGFVGEVVGKTPDMPAKQRGHEIRRWLKDNGRPLTNFVILDDDSDMAGLAHRLVKTSCKLGLEREHVEKALEIIRRP